MLEPHEEHRLDDAGNPAGGESAGRGYSIVWQDGPLVDPVSGERMEPNGAFVETVLEAAIGRMRFYQTGSNGKFACRENALAITHMEEALHWLNARTAAREKRGVEGTHTP